ncbi:GNAT family N-acetyltransferase [Actinomycetospora sp. CA-101289]|uniref:GNAT family N-acetyltransferase n=1 Tax=Actinomycetospora sp. CA-101289 TaxID=3239893 RepID=UPI003D962B65
MTRAVARELAGVRVTSPAPRAVWATAFAADPHAVPSQSPQWADCLAATRGRVDASRLYELPDGRALVLPLAGRQVAGVRVAEDSWPYGWVYGGALSTEGPVTEADAAIVLADLVRRPVVRTGVVPMPMTGPSWTSAADGLGVPVQRVPYLSQSLALDGGFDHVWAKRYRKQARRWIKKAGASGLDVAEYAGSHALPAVAVFADLYRQSIDRWAADMGRPLPIARAHARLQDRPGHLARVVRGLGDMVRVWTAHRAGEPVSVLVVLEHGPHSFGWLAAMDVRLGAETNAGHLLQSLAIESACAAGRDWFHMGESAPGSGVERFKTSFGAVPMPYEALFTERLPLTAADRALRRAVTAVTTRRRRSTDDESEAQEAK